MGAALSVTLAGKAKRSSRMVKFNDGRGEGGGGGERQCRAPLPEKILTFSKGRQHFRTAVKLNGRFSNCPLPFLAITRHGVLGLFAPHSLWSPVRETFKTVTSLLRREGRGRSRDGKSFGEKRVAGSIEHNRKTGLE